MRFLWKITKDFIDEGEANGIGNTEGNEDAILNEKFKLYDDDGELYFEGASNDQSSEAAFVPLDWAMGNYGCTDIEYLDANTGKWVSL